MNAPTRNVVPNNLEAFWMPFTANRQFKTNPRMFVARQGHALLDRRRPPGARRHGGPVVRAMPATAGPRSSRRSRSRPPSSTTRRPSRWATPRPSSSPRGSSSCTPQGLDHVFFTNSGSESVETALKIALAYQRARGEGSRFRLIGRERGYHGVNFGGISVGGIVANRKMFGTLLTGVDHIRHTHDLARNAFSRGQPEHGAELADDLERVVALHDASTIAAVIVEPVAGSTGVLIPPKGYLEKLRAICDKYGILLIFDEVITGFGRLGTPFARRLFRRHAGHDHHRQGHHQRRHPDGRGVRQEGDLRRLHDTAPST